MDLTPTANQPIGPFYHFALTPDNAGGVMAGPAARGERIVLVVKVLDMQGALVTNAMIELWQADSEGRYSHPADPHAKDADPEFKGFGRMATDDAGLCVFDTVKPGAVEGFKGRMQAPHINVSVYTPGLLLRAVTRIYFEDDPANETDQVLGIVPADRRPTLMARVGPGAGEWCFDLHLAGPCETVFFDI